MELEKLVDKRFRTVEGKWRDELELVDEALGRPHIALSIPLPEGCEGMEEAFRKLPEDEEFVRELQCFIREALRRRREGGGGGGEATTAE